MQGPIIDMSKKLLIMFFCSMLMLAACSQKNEEPAAVSTLSITEEPRITLQSAFEASKVTYEYTEARVKVYDPGERFMFGRDMLCATVGGHIFSFESSIPIEERDKCIFATKMILDELGFNGALAIVICNTETYAGTYVEAGTLYTHVQSWDEPEYVADILLGIYGEFCNYGAAYGYAGYLSEILFGNAIDIAPLELSSVTEPESLDLTLLCFDEALVSTAEITRNKNVALSFAQTYINANGTEKYEELLAASGKADCVGTFTNELSGFYEKNGISYLPTEILYAFGGISYDYLAKSKYAEFLIEENWYDEAYEGSSIMSETFLHESYRDVRNFFEKNTECMEEAREKFGATDYDSIVNFYFSNIENGAPNASFYRITDQTVYIKFAISVIHEYIHAITYDKIANPQRWNLEGIAEYYQYIYDCGRLEHYNESYKEFLAKPEEIKKDKYYIYEYSQKIGRDIDFTIDQVELDNAYVFSHGYYDPNNGYETAESFVAFLINNWGEQEFLDALFSETGISGEVYDEMVAEWTAYIKENYSDYTKYP